MVERWTDALAKLARDPDWLARNEKLGGIPAIRSPAAGRRPMRYAYGSATRSVRQNGIAKRHSMRYAIELIYVLIAVAVGFGATLVMDLWGILLKHTFSIPSSNYCFVGRWLRYMPEGIFRHSSIAAAPHKPAECAVGWIAHYAIGAIFALALVLLATPQWLREPTVLPAMILGIATVAIPFLVMQPSFGQGVAASKTPNPTQARLRSIMNHAVFGFGLYISALALSVVFKANA